MNDTDPANFWKINTFNFYVNPLKSSRAWVNIFLNNETYDPSDYLDLMYLTGLQGSDVTTLLHSKTSKIKAFFLT